MIKEQKKITVQDLIAKKQQGKKIVRLICYDYIMGLLADRAGIDSILVGDSASMVMMGMPNTMSIEMDEMIYHCKGVMRAVKYSFVVGDLPFLSFQTSKRDAIYNAGRLMKYGGVDAVKLEGGQEVVPLVKAIVGAGIPVGGHIGLTPQSASKIGGYKVQGTDPATAHRLIEDALALESAGIFMLSLECVPDRVAEIITKKLTVPVIGIGSGPYTDGQSLNIYDILGLFERFTPKFVKKYATFAEDTVKILNRYKTEVEGGIFPGLEHSFHIKEEALKTLITSYKTDH